MKILLVVHQCEPNKGREQGRGWHWTTQLANLGHQVVAITQQKNEIYIEPALERLSHQSKPKFIYLSDYTLTQLLFGKAKYGGTIVSYLTWQFKALKVAEKLDDSYDFDLVHHVTMGSFTGSSLFWLLQKPFVFGPVGGGQVAPSAYKKYLLGGWWIELLRTFLTTRFMRLHLPLVMMLRNTHLLLSVNRDTEVLARAMGAQWIELCSGAALPEDYFPGEFPTRVQTEELRLIWVGRLFPRKALLLALEAIAQVSSAVPVRLSIVGGGKQKKYLDQWLSKLELQKKVRYLGFLDWKDVREKYCCHDVMMFTSLRDSLGVQLLEAMATGLPVITLNHHGARDFVPDDAGIKVSVDDPNTTVAQLADAIEYLYYHPEKRLRMGEKAYEYAKQQTWENTVSKAVDWYDLILAKSKLSV